MESEKNNSSQDYKIFIAVVVLLISGSLYYGYTQVEILNEIMPPSAAIGFILIMVLGSLWYLLSRTKKK